jgi:hypothetical protein
MADPMYPHSWRRVGISTGHIPTDHQCWRCLILLGEAAVLGSLNNCPKHPDIPPVRPVPEEEAVDG